MAGPPSPNPSVPVPATVLMLPEVSTLRMRLLPSSAMKKMLPEESTATPLGKFNWALVAGPPSPPCG